MNPTLLAHVDAALQAIGVNVDAHHNGYEHAYRSVATELRKLLCDWHKGDISLLPQLYPDLLLHVLPGDPEIMQFATLFITTHTTHDGAGGVVTGPLFDESGPLLPLREWLKQPIFNMNITLGGLLKLVGNQEGAHGDMKPDETLRFTKAIFISKESLATQTVIQVAAYIVKSVGIKTVVVSDYFSSLIETAGPNAERGLLVLDLRALCRYGVRRTRVKRVPQGEITSNQFLNVEDVRSLVGQYDPSRECIIATLELDGKQSLHRIDLSGNWICV